MDLASVVAALASVGVRVSGSIPNNNIQGDSSRACPTGLAGPEPSGTLNDPGQHFQSVTRIISPCALGTPKHLALATLSLSSSNACCSCGPQRQVVLFLIKSGRTALV